MPAAQPRTLHTTGTCTVSTRAGSAGAPASAAGAGCCPARGSARRRPALRATMSAPPQKWSPAPSSTITRTASSVDPRRRARRSRPRIIASSIALRLSGRSSVRRSTPPSSATARPSTGDSERRSSARELLGDRVERVAGGRVAPPGGSGRRTGPCSRLGQQDRRVARAWSTSPRWFTASSSRSTAGRSPSARYLRTTRAAQPLRVADVVEPPELAVELPQPGVVAHPVGAEVDEPRLAHAAVVERGRVARRGGRTRGPSARAASRRGRSAVVAVEEARDALPVLVRRAAAASRRRGPCPSPRASRPCR